MVKIEDNLINNVCAAAPSCEEISSDSQIGMMQVKAAQLAVKATKVTDDGSDAAVFFGGSRAVALTKLFGLLCVIFGHFDFRTDSFILQMSDLPGWEGFMKKQIWQF